MADRGLRNQTITFGDYHIEVAMHPTKRSRDLKTEYVDEEGCKVTGGRGGGGGRAPAGAQKAVRLSETRVVRLPAERLEAIEQRSRDQWGDMQVLETLDYRRVPAERIVGSYWLQPRAGTAKALRLITEALHVSDRVAVVKWCASSREKLGILRPRRNGKALLLSELAFANDFAEPDEDVMLDDVEVGGGELHAAFQMVETFGRKRGELPAIDVVTDEAVDARLALYQQLLTAQVDHDLEQSVDELAPAVEERAR